MTELLLAPLATLKECAKRLRAVAKEEFGLSLRQEDAMRVLLENCDTATEAEYRQKLDIQALENFQPANNGLNPIHEITQLMKDALRKALLVETPTSEVLMQYIHLFSQRNGEFQHLQEMEKIGLKAALHAVLIGLANERQMTITKTVTRHAYDLGEQPTEKEYWNKAVDYAVLSVEMNLDTALRRKRQTKHLLEFYSENAVSDLVRSRQYHEIVEHALINFDWFCAP